MKKIVWLIILVVVVVVVGYVWSLNNRLVTADQSVKTQWAKVETQYQRRFDLIPNLVNSVKGAMAQEKDVFKAIADARTKYGSAGTPEAKVKAANEVESAFSRLLVVMENYPQLKSIETVQTLMVQLEGTENRVSVERTRFNDEVKSYNLLVKIFPGNLIAGMLGYGEKEYFQAAAGANNAPEVKF
jgi:LemA protein